MEISTATAPFPQVLRLLTVTLVSNFLGQWVGLNMNIYKAEQK